MLPINAESTAAEAAATDIEEVLAVLVLLAALVLAVASDEPVPLLAAPPLLCALINELSKSTALRAPLDEPEPSIEIRLESEDNLTAVLVMPLMTLLLAVVLATLVDELVVAVPMRLAIKRLDEDVSIVVITLDPKNFAFNIALLDRKYTWPR